ncbi:hypothetical protein HMI56_003678 [Coelomomyces lativittatus]|nr:hypothetical protein HMI56_003678 [Coelomomyces lativittatus]
MKVNGPVITEDTCLGFHALKGLPGPYIKWFLEKLGHEGLNQLLSSYTDKSAFALCTLAYCEGPGEEPILFEGQTEGQLVSPRSSSSKSSTFGWDPIFQPQGFSLTYAEMPSSLKHTLSHRSKALTLLKSFLQHHPTFSEFMNQPTPTHSPHHPSLNT